MTKRIGKLPEASKKDRMNDQKEANDEKPVIAKDAELQEICDDGFPLLKEFIGQSKKKQPEPSPSIILDQQ